MVLVTPENALLPTVAATLLLEVMLCNPVQPEKAELPMEVTELGMVRAVIKLAP